MNIATEDEYSRILNKLIKLESRDLQKVRLAANSLHFTQTTKGIDRTFTPKELDEMIETKLELDAEFIAKKA
jgi:hypothetical protein